MTHRHRSHKRQPKGYERAQRQLSEHYLLGPLTGAMNFRPVVPPSRTVLPAGAYCQIDIDGTVRFDPSVKLSNEQWFGVFALAALVLASGVARRLPVPARITDLAAQIAALHTWQQVRAGELPEHIALPPGYLQWGRQPLEAIASRLHTEPINEVLDGQWTLTRSQQPLLTAERAQTTHHHQRPDFESIFAQALVDNAKRALQLQQSGNPSDGRADPNGPPARARRWLLTHYPLLGSLLSEFELVEDAELCDRLNIHIAAIQVGTGEIFINPRRHLGFEQAKFVIAHEILHAGLNHASRRQGRDPYLWNVACDFVINDWLVSMNLGIAPDGGLLFDDTLRGQAAEDIYRSLASELRVRRRLSTLRGADVDILDDRAGRCFTDREAFCRRALAQGLDFHQSSARSLLPAGLVEAIRTLNQPPIPWQAQLAAWIQERCPVPERQRSWARPSRRQSVTPDIPRPRFVEPEEERTTHTFGVILDTSASMDRADLGKALGAIVAFSQAQSVRQVRLVFCDATPYDEGYVDVDALAARARVRGRGGTVLQPAVDMLLGQPDFPKDCSVLIITDGQCEPKLEVRRDHAFLLCPGMHLPFQTQSPVFQMK
ncbi:MAG: hypothetical protein R3E87_19675 [Burkholderiaceae bacterium]